MSIYHFNLFNSVTVPDDQGTDLPDLDAARAYALSNIRHIAAADVLEGQLDLGHRIEIADDAGTILLTLYFRDALAVQSAA